MPVPVPPHAAIALCREVGNGHLRAAQDSIALINGSTASINSSIASINGRTASINGSTGRSLTGIWERRRAERIASLVAA
eukprot:3941994-Rhodomonas_salina.2